MSRSLVSTYADVLQTSLEGKSFKVFLSQAALCALAERKSPLIAEMQSYFSCLTRLRVRFSESEPEGTATPVNPHLHIRFRPVITARCDLQEVEGKPPLVDAPLVKRFPFVPRWLQLDFKRGLWMGEFGHTEMA
jgi:hypothetical protein